MSLTLKPSKHFSANDLEQALYSVEEVMERTQMEYVLTGETARQVRENLLLDVPAITVGIRRNIYLGGMNLLKIVLPDITLTENGFETDYHGVPIEVKVYEADYPAMKDPDIRFYGVTQFLLPNPWGPYWEAYERSRT